MQYLTDSYNFLVNTMHFEILIDPQMYLYLFDGVISLIKHMLGFVNFAKTTLSNDFNLLEQPGVSILFQVLRILVFICLLLVPENKSVLIILPRWWVFRHRYEWNILLIRVHLLLGQLRLLHKLLSLLLTYGLRSHQIWHLNILINFMFSNFRPIVLDIKLWRIDVRIIKWAYLPIFHYFPWVAVN